MIRHGGVAILVADESAMMREVMRTVLRSLNYHSVTEADCGSQALAAFESADGRPGLAFIDVALRSPSGIDVLQAIRRDWPDTFVVMASGGHLPSDLERAVENGADAFLVKPYRLSRVEQALEKFLEVRPRVLPSGYSGVA